MLLGDADDLGVQAYVWDTLGYVHHRLGHGTEAADSYRRSAELFRRDGDRHAEARTLIRLGDVQCAYGDREAARYAWHRELSIMD